MEQSTVGDEPKSQNGTNTLNTNEPQTVLHPVTVHSSLDAIVAMCDEVRAMDL